MQRTVHVSAAAAAARAAQAQCAPCMGGNAGLKLWRRRLVVFNAVSLLSELRPDLAATSIMINDRILSSESLSYSLWLSTTHNNTIFCSVWVCVCVCAAFYPIFFLSLFSLSIILFNEKKNIYKNYYYYIYCIFSSQNNIFFSPLFLVLLQGKVSYKRLICQNL